MMITIHGFPTKTKYQDVKILIKQECNINDFILDNLINDTNGTKKVRIGLTDNTEGYKVMKCLDGYRMPGNFILKAVPVGKPASSLPPSQSGFESRPSYQNQPRNDYSSTPRNDYMSQPSNDYNHQGSHGSGMLHSQGGTHGSSGIHGSLGSHGGGGSLAPRPSQGGPHSHSAPHGSVAPQGSMDSGVRPSPWVSGGGNSNQWNPPMMSQVPQNTFGFGSPQASNVNPSYGQQQHQGHGRPVYNQGRAAEQGYGYIPKSSVPEVVPANSRYRWVKGAEPELKVPKSPQNDEDSSCSSSADDNLDKKSQAVSNDPEEQGPGETSGKARKIKQAHLRNISRLTRAQKRRLYFWLKLGKSFMEARELCETRKNKVPEYPAAKAETKRKARDVALRQMSPERQAREIHVGRLKGFAIPGAPPLPWPPGPSICVRIIDEVGRMSQEKIEKLQDKILELLDAEPDGNGPSFVGCSSLSGGLVLNCANAQSVEWVKNHLPDYQLWEGAQIRIIDKSELPKHVIGVAYIPYPNLNEEAILSMLSSQNQGIDFSDWRITHTNLDISAGQTVSFSIGHLSVEKLEEINNFVYIGSKKIKIRLQRKKVKVPPGQEPKGEMGMPLGGQMAKGPRGKMGMPPRDQMGTGSKGKMGMLPGDQMGTGPRGKMGVPPGDQMGTEPKGTMGMPPGDQMGTGPRRKMGMPPGGQMGNGPRGKMGMPPGDQMRNGPRGKMVMPPGDQMRTGPRGKMGMPPGDQMGTEPRGKMGMPPGGQMGKGPKRGINMPSRGQTGITTPMDQVGMASMRSMDMVPMGPMGIGPLGPMDMGFMGPMNMRPTGPRGMGPTVTMRIGRMGSMGMPPMDQMGMPPMENDSGFMPSASNARAMRGPPGGSSCSPGYSQPNDFGYGNHPKNFGGGMKPNYIQKRGGPAADGDPNPKGTHKKKSSRGKGKKKTYR